MGIRLSSVTRRCSKLGRETGEGAVVRQETFLSEKVDKEAYASIVFPSVPSIHDVLRTYSWQSKIHGSQQEPGLLVVNNNFFL